MSDDELLDRLERALGRIEFSQEYAPTEIETQSPEGALGLIDLGPDREWDHIAPPPYERAFCGELRNGRQLRDLDDPVHPICPDCERIAAKYGRVPE